MRNIRKSGITALTAAIALSLGAVPLAVTAGMLPDGETTVISPTTFGTDIVGYLAIEKPSAGADRINWYTRPATPTTPWPSSGVQTIDAAARNCALVTSPLDTAATAIMSFNGKYGANADAESWALGSIGVAEKKSGTSCSQVNTATAESLDIEVGDAVVTSSGRLVAKSAYFDVELKQDARILATATLGGSTVGYFELQSGSTIGSTTKPSGVTSGVPYAIQACNNPSDSGPDSGPNDNCRWAISTPAGVGVDDGIMFDAVSLRAVNGSFSLEYGRDGDVTSGEQGVTEPAWMPPGASYLELVEVDGLLACNGTTVTRALSGTEPQVSIRRLGNASSNETCTSIPYTLSNDPSSSRFLKPLNQQTTAQFVADFVWSGVPTAGTTALPVTKVDFETPTTGVEIVIGWCPRPLYQGTITIGGLTVPKLVGIADPSAVTDLDELPGKQFACLGVQSTSVVAPSNPTTINENPTTAQVRTVEQMYILGDIRSLK